MLPGFDCDSLWGGSGRSAWPRSCGRAGSRAPSSSSDPGRSLRGEPVKQEGSTQMGGEKALISNLETAFLQYFPNAFFVLVSDWRNKYERNSPASGQEDARHQFCAGSKTNSSDSRRTAASLNLEDKVLGRCMNQNMSLPLSTCLSNTLKVAPQEDQWQGWWGEKMHRTGQPTCFSCCQRWCRVWMIYGRISHCEKQVA